MWTTPGMWASMYSSSSRTSTIATPLAWRPAKVSMSTSGASGWLDGMLMNPFLPRPRSPGVGGCRLPQGSEGPECLGRGRGGRAVGLLQGGKDLLAVDVDAAGGLDSDAHLVAPHFQHGHDDIRPDHDALVRMPGEHEHWAPLPWTAWSEGQSTGRCWTQTKGVRRSYVVLVRTAWAARLVWRFTTMGPSRLAVASAARSPRVTMARTKASSPRARSRRSAVLSSISGS